MIPFLDRIEEKKRINRLLDGEDRALFDGHYQTYFGGVWERLVREEIHRKPLPGCEERFRNAARWWGAGLDRQPMELDVVAESLDGKTLLVGEAKLFLSEAEASRAVKKLEDKARQLPFANKYEKILTKLFVAKDPPPGVVSLDWCEE